MTKDLFNGNNDSSIFKVKIREQDLSAEEKLNELKGAAEEIARKSALERLKLEREVCGHVDCIFSQVERNNEEDFSNVLSGVELPIEEEEDYFTSGIDTLLQELFKFFKPFFNEFDVDVDPKIYNIIKERKEKSWLASIIKFLHDKVKELIRKIFSKDLSLGEKIENEIKKLEERLFGDGLSEEEKIEVLERLAALHDLKLKLQMFAVGWILTTLATLFEVDLTAMIETGTTKEEDKKAKETSSKEKEATKEVCEDIGIKVDEREKPQPIVSISLFDFSSGLVKPITLTKPEHDLLPKLLKDILPPVPKEVINNKKSEIKEAKVEQQNKQAKPEAPKKQVCPSAVLEQTPGVNRTIFSSENSKVTTGKNIDSSESISRREAMPTNQRNTTNNFKGKGSESTNEYKTDDPFAKLREKVAQKKAQEEPATDAQPSRELIDDIKVNNHVNSMGKAPEEVSSRGR